jgi:hypothetical protein
MVFIGELFLSVMGVAVVGFMIWFAIGSSVALARSFRDSIYKRDNNRLSELLKNYKEGFNNAQDRIKQLETERLKCLALS